MRESMRQGTKLCPPPSGRNGRSIIEDVAVLHITKSELARDVDGVLEKVRAGAEVVIEEDRRAVAVIRAPHVTKTTQRPGRMLSECIALAEAHGSTVTLDDEFGKDLEEIIQSHPGPLASRWD